MVEIFYQGKRAASPARSCAKGHATLIEHMPKPHREYAQWTPTRIINWTKETEPGTDS
jgi:hypothetical protein